MLCLMVDHVDLKFPYVLQSALSYFKERRYINIYNITINESSTL